MFDLTNQSGNIGYILGSKEGSYQCRIALYRKEIGFDAILQSFTFDKCAPRGSSALHVVPYQLVRIEIRRVAGKKVKFQFSSGRFGVIADHFGFVSGQNTPLASTTDAADTD